MILSNDTTVTAEFSLKEELQLISFKKGDLEIIDPAAPFFVGLRLDSDCPKAPWSGELKEGILSASLTGEDEWNQTSLANSEGQGFKLHSTATLDGDALRLYHSVVSDTDSLVGNLFHLRLPEGANHIEFDSKEHIYVSGHLKPIPPQWSRSEEGRITIPVKADLDLGILPFLNPTGGTIRLITKDYQVEVGYQSTNQESSWYVTSHKGSSHISLGAVSSQNPWKPNLTVSSINLSLRVL